MTSCTGREVTSFVRVILRVRVQVVGERRTEWGVYRGATARRAAQAARCRNVRKLPVLLQAARRQ